MNILGIGPLELLFIILIILLVLKPEDIGKMARSAGKALNRVYRSSEWRMVSRAARDLKNLPNRLMREAELEELNTIRKDLEETSRTLQRENRNLRVDLSGVEESVREDSSMQLPAAGAGAEASSDKATDGQDRAAQESPGQAE